MECNETVTIQIQTYLLIGYRNNTKEEEEWIHAFNLTY